MIRTIVIDDEPYIRKSIVTSIQNANKNFKVIAEAGNGQQAYNLITDLHPDVIFLDIRMPIMDGISLLEKLHQNNIVPIRVILSGYSEFEYAKKAIMYQVFDYVLKPIHMEQLSILLSNIEERVYQKKINEEYQYLNYIFKGIKPSLSFDKLSVSIDQYKEYFCFYMIAGSYMYTKNNQFDPTGDFWKSNTLVSNISTNISSTEQIWSISGENQNEILLIIGSKITGNCSSKHLATCIFEATNKSSIPITLVYTPNATTLENIKDAVIDLKYSAVQKIKFAHSSIVSLEKNIEQRCISGSEHQDTFKNLEELIQEKRYHDFKNSIKHLLLIFSNQKLSQRQLKVELIRILEIMQGEHLSQEMQEFIDETLTNTFSYNDLSALLLQYIEDYSQNYYQVFSSDMAKTICTYINEKYDSSLTLKEIAAHFHISPSYLSTLFKKTYNISPNEYIMNKRISKSKDLLAAFPPISIKQISLMIGYTDPFYFSRIFKMVTGQTPTEYRDSQYKIQK